MRLHEACGVALLTALALFQSSCLLPVRFASGVEGVVVDQATGRPLPDAVVVVRFDGRYGDMLPDREQLGHAETTTDAEGRFRVDGYVKPGIMAWPLFHTEARVAGVLREGYRCAEPVKVPGSGRVRIGLTSALDLADQRASCRPVPARGGEAEVYMASWRALFPSPASSQEREERRQMERLLEARAAFGFGENCQGPVADLALAPGGRRAAFVALAGDDAQVHLVEIDAQGAGLPQRVSAAAETPPRQLAWTGSDELVLWLPSSDVDRAVSPSVFAPGHAALVWTSRHSLPASIDRGARGEKPSQPRRPLDPEDLSDEAQTSWQGRSFVLDHELDADTGLAHDRLRITYEDGRRSEIELPGEACGGARFGRPHYRIAGAGRFGLDLRFIDGGCHALAIDLESGDWAQLDRSRGEAVCRAQRRVPPAHLATALRSWTQALTAAFERTGADPGAAYSLRIARNGATQALARDFSGEPITVKAPPFPLKTPLRRIDVTTIAPATRGTRIPRSAEPLPEPL